MMKESKTIKLQAKTPPKMAILLVKNQLLAVGAKLRPLKSPTAVNQSARGRKRTDLEQITTRQTRKRLKIFKMCPRPR